MFWQKKMVSYIQLKKSLFSDFTDYYPALSILYNYTQVLPTKMEVSITYNLEENYLTTSNLAWLTQISTFSALLTFKTRKREF